MYPLCYISILNQDSLSVIYSLFAMRFLIVKSRNFTIYGPYRNMALFPVYLVITGCFLLVMKDIPYRVNHLNNQRLHAVSLFLNHFCYLLDGIFPPNFIPVDK